MAEWTRKNVEERFKESVNTLRRLPRAIDLEYKTHWPEMIYSRWELFLQEPRPLREGPPAPDAIDRMIETFDWLLLVDERKRKIIWMRAESTRWKVVAYTNGISRSSAITEHNQALTIIAFHLNKQQNDLNKS